MLLTKPSQALDPQAQRIPGAAKPASQFHLLRASWDIRQLAAVGRDLEVPTCCPLAIQTMTGCMLENRPESRLARSFSTDIGKSLWKPACSSLLEPFHRQRHTAWPAL